MRRSVKYGIVALSGIASLLLFMDILLLGLIMPGVMGYNSNDMAIAISRSPRSIQNLVINHFLRGGIISSSTNMREMILILDYAEDHQLGLAYDRRLLIPFIDGEKLAAKYRDMNFREPVEAVARKIIVNYGDAELVKMVFEEYGSRSDVIRRFCYTPRGDIDLRYMQFIDSTCSLHLQDKSKSINRPAATN